MGKYIKCPICKEDKIFIGVHDDEGNCKGAPGCGYESDPWSGLCYGLHHDGWGECLLCTDGAYDPMGGMLFDSVGEALDLLFGEHGAPVNKTWRVPSKEEWIRQYGTNKQIAGYEKRKESHHVE